MTIVDYKDDDDDDVGSCKLYNVHLLISYV